MKAVLRLSNNNNFTGESSSSLSSAFSFVGVSSESFSVISSFFFFVFSSSSSLRIESTVLSVFLEIEPKIDFVGFMDIDTDFFVAGAFFVFNEAISKCSIFNIY